MFAYSLYGIFKKQLMFNAVCSPGSSAYLHMSICKWAVTHLSLHMWVNLALLKLSILFKWQVLTYRVQRFWFLTIHDQPPNVNFYISVLTFTPLLKWLNMSHQNSLRADKLDSGSIPHCGYKTSTFLPEVPFLRTMIRGYLSQECSGNQQTFAQLFEVYKLCIWVKSSSCIHRKLFPRRKVWLFIPIHLNLWC